jgi:bifunctional non-homologous end joining protein LigD
LKLRGKIGDLFNLGSVLRVLRASNAVVGRASVALAADRSCAILRLPHAEFRLSPAAARAEIPHPLHLQIVSPSVQAPDGESWLHEMKHDGHRLLAIVAGSELRLISRNGHDRTPLFRAPFDKLAAAGLPPLVLDGEIAVPDERGVTHIDLLTQAMRQCHPERLAYFVFDLVHLDAHELRACTIEDRKALLRDVIGAAGCQRIVVINHVVGIGRQLLEAMRQIGAEGIVSKRAGSPYRGGLSRDWLKMSGCRRRRSELLQHMRLRFVTIRPVKHAYTGRAECLGEPWGVLGSPIALG